MNKTIWIAKNNSQPVDHIINVNDDYKREYGEYAYQLIPCAEIMKFYQLLTVNDDEDLYLTKQDHSKMKDRCR